MNTNTPLEQLQELLKELFQLNNTDLDFGIYRILNLKSKEVDTFIREHLPKRVDVVKEKILARQSIDLKTALENLKRELATKFQVNFDQPGDIEAKADQYGQLPLFREPYDKYVEAKKKLDALRVSEDTERSIYNELYRFFDRYYEGGDFISKPRAGKDAYMIPYNGDEVKLYWANHDQYYIKTSENYKNYVFTNNSQNPENLVTVEFKLVDAETVSNKEEKDRRFVPIDKPFDWDEANRKLTVSFHHKVPSADEKARWGEKQNVKKDDKGINQRLYAAMEKYVQKTKHPELMSFWAKIRKNSKGEEQPIFQYHLNRYTESNTFDYFIHKDLRGFLSRELDYFLKNEVLSVNFLDPDWKETEVQEAIKLNVLKASAIRDLAMTVIDFLAELEDFQKRLWEKKKFVVQSDYCMTLDLIADEKVRDKIVDFILTDKDKKQIGEWIRLGFIESKKDVKNLSKLLKDADNRLKYLVLDTQFLPSDLKARLLASVENLDSRLNGLLLNSENWQALEFLIPKLARKIECVYIDPPYNTGDSEIAYKNNYLFASWLTLMENRIERALKLFSDDPIMFIAIDDFELSDLCELIDTHFKRMRREMIVVNHHPQGGKARTLANTHEYMLTCVKSSSDRTLTGRLVEDETEHRPFKRSGTAESNFRYGRPNSFYAILVNPVTKAVVGLEPPPHMGEEYQTGATREGLIRVYPLGIGGEERVWRRSYEKCAPLIEDKSLICTDNMTIYQLIEAGDRTPALFSNWIGKRYNAGTYGANLLSDIMGQHSLFSYPKSLHTVADAIYASELDGDGYCLDFFGGSGTTAHAVITLNREDGQNRKYVLVEMARYFDTVTKPRVQKVIFSDKWKDGTPQEQGKGITQLFQYLKLEQYEDTLNNIQFRTGDSQLSFEDQLRFEFTHGVQGSDCLLNVEKFTKPFNYTMKIIRQNEVVPDQSIDLVTTFNFFLGIEVNRFVIEKHQGQEYRIVLGKKRQQEYIIVWRNFDEEKLDLTKERDWIQKQPWFNRDALIYCNADNAFGAQSTEAEFKRIMNEPVQ